MPTFQKRRKDVPVDLAVISGSVAALNAAVTADVTEWSTVAFTVTANASFVGTIAFEASNDNANWIAISVTSVSANNQITTTTSPVLGSIYRASTTGIKYVRVRASAYTSGSVTFGIFRTMEDNTDFGNSVTVASGAGLVLGAGTALVGDVGSQVRTGAGGLASIARLLSAAASTNATSVKTSAGRVYKIRGYNAAAAVRYLKLYNKASAPTVGTDTPVATIALKATDVFDINFSEIGQYFATGIAYALTVNGTDADTTALTTADVVGLNIWYA